MVSMEAAGGSATTDLRSSTAGCDGHSWLLINNLSAREGQEVGCGRNGGAGERVVRMRVSEDGSMNQELGP